MLPSHQTCSRHHEHTLGERGFTRKCSVRPLERGAQSRAGRSQRPEPVWGRVSRSPVGSGPEDKQALRKGLRREGKLPGYPGRNTLGRDAGEAPEGWSDSLFSGSEVGAETVSNFTTAAADPGPTVRTTEPGQRPGQGSTWVFKGQPVGHCGRHGVRLVLEVGAAWCRLGAMRSHPSRHRDPWCGPCRPCPRGAAGPAPWTAGGLPSFRSAHSILARSPFLLTGLRNPGPQTTLWEPTEPSRMKGFLSQDGVW